MSPNKTKEPRKIHKRLRHVPIQHFRHEIKLSRSYSLPEPRNIPPKPIAPPEVHLPQFAEPIPVNAIRRTSDRYHPYAAWESFPQRRPSSVALPQIEASYPGSSYDNLGHHWQMGAHGSSPVAQVQHASDSHIPRSIPQPNSGTSYQFSNTQEDYSPDYPHQCDQTSTHAYNSFYFDGPQPPSFMPSASTTISRPLSTPLVPGYHIASSQAPQNDHPLYYLPGGNFHSNPLSTDGLSSVPFQQQPMHVPQVNEDCFIDFASHSDTGEILE